MMTEYLVIPKSAVVSINISDPETVTLETLGGDPKVVIVADPLAAVECYRKEIMEVKVDESDPIFRSWGVNGLDIPGCGG